MKVDDTEMRHMRKRRGNQSGFTMTELMVALAVSSLIVVGSIMFLTYMITLADVNRDKTVASLEVQYVGFWMNEDVAQAQEIWLGDDPGDEDGFPMTLKWENYEQTRKEEITYHVEEMADGQLWRFMRDRDVYVKVGEEYELDTTQSGTSQVAEYLIPWPGEDEVRTGICRKAYSTDYGDVYSMIVDAAAQADRSEASSSYEIYPRAVAKWYPQDVDSQYVGPACPEG
ncbi:MAG: prepilin-type N-terminal cleavage/methylation domain-containing protein [Dehalococcoidia bacterium]|nr:MAG: prepilin-type N-terminal cleavage/methylation domain-containing protein [Dehalococcoidia bacterium]